MTRDEAGEAASAIGGRSFLRDNPDGTVSVLMPFFPGIKALFWISQNGYEVRRRSGSAYYELARA